MKQLLLTIKNPFNSQLEVKNFLSKCDHSPEWIGDPEQWEIKTFRFYTDKRGDNNICALIQNNEWKEPTATPLTYRQIYDLLKNDREKKLYIGIRKGISGTEKYSFGRINDLGGMCKFYAQNNNPQITVNRLFDEFGLELFDEPEKDPDYLELMSEMAVLIYSGENGKGHPVTEVVKEVVDKEEIVILIYNQDIVNGFGEN